MKKTQIIELFKNIKKTIVSFISIGIFIALATALFLGINWSTTTFSRMVDKTVNDGEMHNLEITYPYGLTDEFVNEIKNTKDVSEAEGYYSSEEHFRFDGFNYQARVITLTDNINIPTAIEGTLPNKKGEIAVQKFFADTHNIKIGDEIVFEHNDDGKAHTLKNLLNEDLEALNKQESTADGISSLLTDKYVVTALIETPQYINQYDITYGISQTTSIPNNCILYIDESSVDKDAFAGYSNLIIRNRKLDDYVSLTDEYDEKSDEFLDEIKPLVVEYTNKRNDEVITSVKNIERSIVQEINDGEKLIADAEEILGDELKKLEDGRKQLEDALKQINDSQSQINAGRSQISGAQSKINENEDMLNKVQKIYDVTSDALDTIIFINNNLENIKGSLKKIHDFLGAFRDIIKYSLPDDYYTLTLLDKLYEELNNGEYDGKIEEFTEDYLILIDLINNSDICAKIDEVIADFKKKGEEKYEIKLIVDALKNLNKNYNNNLNIPKQIFDDYNILKNKKDSYPSNPVIEEINKVLTDKEIKSLLLLINPIINAEFEPPKPENINDLLDVIEASLTEYNDARVAFNYVIRMNIDELVNGKSEADQIEARAFYNLALNILECNAICSTNLEMPNIPIEADISDILNSLIAEHGPEILDNLYKIMLIYEKYEDIIDDILDDGIDLMDIINSFLNDAKTEEYKNNPAKLTRRYIAFLDQLNNSGFSQTYKDLVIGLEYMYYYEDFKLENSIFAKLASEMEYLKGEANSILELPLELVEIYNMIKGSELLPIFEQKISKEIDDILTENNVPTLKEIVEFLDEQLDDDEESFEKIVEMVDDLRIKLGDNLNKFKNLLKEEIEPLLQNAWNELNNAKRQLQSGINQLNSSQAEVDKAREEYNKGLRTLKSKELEYADALAELDEGRLKVEEGKTKLLDYQKLTKQIESYDSSVLGRNANAALASTVSPIVVMGKIKYTMSLLFVIVGLFVCYSTVSRIVYEDTKLIGTKKALGLKRREVTRTYIFYALMAGVFGTILGNILAVFVVEPIISAALGANFILTNKQFFFNIKDSALFFLLEMSATLLFAYFACRKTLRERTVDLLSGRSNTTDKRHFFEKLNVFKKLPLFSKTVILNFFNDKRRVLATVAGITGCCSLLVCAMLVFFNLYGTRNHQMENITKYDTIVYLDTNKENALANISQKLDAADIEYAPAHSSSMYYKKADGSMINSSSIAFEDEKFKDFFGIMKEGKQISNISEGLWFSDVFARINGLKPGDYITAIDNSGNEKTIKIGGTFDYYLPKVQDLMSSSVYESTFGKDYTNNMLLLNRNDKTIKEMFSLLDGTEGFSSIYDARKECDDLFEAIISVLVIIVITFFVLSFVLAFLVLLNLYTMFVDEKKKELLVMMINGYSRKDAKKYIYKDSILLTSVGILIGSLLGVIVGLLTIRSLDADYITLLREVNVSTFLIAGGITVILSLVNCKIALRKVDKFKLTNINV